MKSVRNNLHEIIDTIEDEALLQSIYELLEETRSQKAGEIWSTMSESQRKETLAAEQEIPYPDKQIDHEEMKKRNKKWLEK